MKEDSFKVERQIDKLKDLLNKMLESPDQDKKKILEISQNLDFYIIEYYKTMIGNREEE
ncbi:MAG: Spo0E family sporulation regulatory protein-aspartic acid phosphatase [Tissierellia bacterium]|nr:Spo0E family sporulation regulatory protein-aspartic acid phosphatase [Tissierellia bacterium]